MLAFICRAASAEAVDSEIPGIIFALMARVKATWPKVQFDAPREASQLTLLMRELAERNPRQLADLLQLVQVQVGWVGVGVRECKTVGSEGPSSTLPLYRNVCKNSTRTHTGVHHTQAVHGTTWVDAKGVCMEMGEGRALRHASAPRAPAFSALAAGLWHGHAAGPQRGRQHGGLQPRRHAASQRQQRQDRQVRFCCNALAAVPTDAYTTGVPTSRWGPDAG